MVGISRIEKWTKNSWFQLGLVVIALVGFVVGIYGTFFKPPPSPLVAVGDYSSYLLARYDSDVLKISINDKEIDNDIYVINFKIRNTGTREVVWDQDVLEGVGFGFSPGSVIEAVDTIESSRVVVGGRVLVGEQTNAGELAWDIMEPGDWMRVTMLVQSLVEPTLTASGTIRQQGEIKRYGELAGKSNRLGDIVIVAVFGVILANRIVRATKHDKPFIDGLIIEMRDLLLGSVLPIGILAVLINAIALLIT